MQRVSLAVALASSICALIACEAEARQGKHNVSPNREFSFQVESNGNSLPTHYHRGRAYVEGTWGDAYQIRVFNHSNERVEAVVTVDGRDVITGKPGNYRKSRGYIIAPYGAVTIDGFRTSFSSVAAFRFTGVGDSYAARMGDSSDVGVIGVAIFREDRPMPPPMYTPNDQRLGSGEMDDLKSRPSSKMGREESMPSSEGRSRASQGIGTGWGQTTYSPATQTTFVRRSSWRPDTVLAIRYDDRQGLIDKGILPQPYYYYPPQPEPNPFPHSDPGFAPPPPPYWWE